MPDEEIVDLTIERTLVREGGFVDDPTDRGGATNWGITLPTLSWIRRRQVTVEELKRLSREGARAVYREYFDRHGILAISDPPLFDLIADFATNTTPGRVIRWLQAAIPTNVDGILGPKTIDALERVDPKVIFRLVLAERFRNFGRIVNNQVREQPNLPIGKSQAKFILGWLNRACEFVERTP